MATGSASNATLHRAGDAMPYSLRSHPKGSAANGPRPSRLINGPVPEIVHEISRSTPTADSVRPCIRSRSKPSRSSRVVPGSITSRAPSQRSTSAGSGMVRARLVRRPAPTSSRARRLLRAAALRTAAVVGDALWCGRCGCEGRRDTCTTIRERAAVVAPAQGPVVEAPGLQGRGIDRTVRHADREQPGRVGRKLGGLDRPGTIAADTDQADRRRPSCSWSTSATRPRGKMWTLAGKSSHAGQSSGGSTIPPDQ